MGTIQTYRDLQVWQKAKDLSIAVYKVTAAFPKEEQFALTSQIRRASISIPSNIAEGYGRGTRPDYTRFLQIARGSLYELRTQIEIASELKFLSKESFLNFSGQAEEIEKMLNTLIKKLQTK